MRYTIIGTIDTTSKMIVTYNEIEAMITEWELRMQGYKTRVITEQ